MMKRQPLWIRSVIVAVAIGVLGIAAAAGLVDEPLQAAVMQAIVLVAAALGVAIPTAVHHKVTPVDDPRDKDGNSLTPKRK